MFMLIDIALVFLMLSVISELYVDFTDCPKMDY